MRKLAFIILILLLVVAQGAWAEPGEVSSSSDPAETSFGARAMGMGGAFVALADDTNSIFLNPAGLGTIKNWGLTSMATQLLQRVNYKLLGGVYPLGIGTVGFGYIGTETPCGYEAADEFSLTGNQITYGSTLLILSYGMDLNKIINTDGIGKLYLGTNLKFLNKGFSGGGEGSASGFEMDIGAIFKPQVDWLTFGASLQNVIPDSLCWDSDTVEDMPFIAKVGGALNILGEKAISNIYSDHELRLILDVEQSLTSEKPLLFHAGAEWKPVDFLSIRVGMDQNPVSVAEAVSNLTMGVGLEYQGFSFDYAYKQDSNLGELSTHYFSVSFSPEEKVKKVVQKEKPKIEAPKKEAKKAKKFEIILEDPSDKLITYNKVEEIAGKVIGAGEGTELMLNKDKLALSKEGEFKSNIVIESVGKKLIVVRAQNKDGSKAEVKNRILRLASFKDVGNNHWAKNPIELCGTTGLVMGYPDGTFKPDNPLSRAELATLLVRAEGIPLGKANQQTFTDLTSTHWAAKYVQAAYEAGLVNGYPDGTFKPNNKISRAEGVAVMARFDNLKEPELGEMKGSPFADLSPRHWAAKLIYAANEAGLLKYLEGNLFSAKKELTRAEAVEILSQTSFGKEKIAALLDWELGFEGPEKEIAHF